MKHQLLEKMIMAAKTKTARFLAILLLVSVPSITQASYVEFGVTFGRPQSNDGACVGKGVCKEHSLDDMDVTTGVYNSSPEAVTVDFVINDANPGVLMMRFSLSELTQKQPDQVAAFTNASGSYTFDGNYSLSNQLYAPLNLQDGAMIGAGVNYPISINGDLVTVYIPYNHS